jgi:hypothetical protein
MNVRIEDQPWWVNLRVRCTDRGTHPSREIAVLHVDLDPEGDIGPSNHGRYQGGTAQWTAQVVEDVDGRRRWRLPCPTCPRAPQLTEQRMRTLTRGLVEHYQPPRGGVVVLDMSHLPS